MNPSYFHTPSAAPLLTSLPLSATYCTSQTLICSSVSAFSQVLGELAGDWWFLVAHTLLLNNNWTHSLRKPASDACDFSASPLLSNSSSGASWISPNFGLKIKPSPSACAGSMILKQSLFLMPSIPLKPWLYFLVILASHIFPSCLLPIFTPFFVALTLLSRCLNLMNRQLPFFVLPLSFPFRLFLRFLLFLLSFQASNLAAFPKISILVFVQVSFLLT